MAPAAEELSIEELQAIIERKKQAEQDQLKRQEEEKRLNDPSRQLVPPSPSPRKKRRLSPDAPPPASKATRPRISAPTFFSATSTSVFDDKLRNGRSLNPSDRVELRKSASTGRNGSRPDSDYASHTSAIPKGVADQIAEAKAIQRAKEERKQKRARALVQSAAASSASNGFPFASTSKDTTLDTLVKGRTGQSTRLSEKGRTVPIGSKEDKKDSSTSSESSSRRSTRSETAKTTGPPMSRTAPASSTSASTSKSVIKPSRAVARVSDDDEDDGLEITGGPQKRTRHKDGTIMEELVSGPKEFEAPPHDPEWSRYEPYSGIHLRERILPHDQLDDLLVGRYHLTPSQIYSLARIDSRQRIDLDPEQIDSDFVVIGVLAWKDEIRFMNSNALGSGRAGGQERGKGKGSDEDGDGEEEDGGDEQQEDGKVRAGGKGKNGKKTTSTSSSSKSGDTLFSAPTRRRRRQQYVRFSLVDLSSTSASSSATGQLSLMLVQADSEDKTVDDEGNEISVYKGQSGGAYEKFWKESAGAVVAIINPNFLPYHKDFSYTLKPTSASSMVVIGRAENLTFCEAIKADGKRCGKWVDARTGRTCQFHVELAIKRTGVRRAETSSNTASMSQKGVFNSSTFKKSLGSSSSRSTANGKPLTPPPGMPPMAQIIAGSTTYVAGGLRSGTGRGGASSSGTLNLPASRAGGGFVAGFREGASVSEEKKRMKRQAEDDKRARRELRDLVGRDKGKTPGGEYLERARRDKENTEREAKKKRKKGGGEKGSSDAEDGAGVGGGGSASPEKGAKPGETASKEKEDRKPAIQSVFKAEALRRIGFNPTAKPGELPRDESAEAKAYRLALEDGMSNRSMDLSAPPGPKIRSVKAPAAETVSSANSTGDHDDDDDLVIEDAPPDGAKLPLPRLPKPN
ncbi:hypothetical protein JCM10908_007349 [Rhodotorula pacifica]|uniref:uncharacterized protein n=1 Tax=Rhodotorula pacifica TaxID=1495444 RepID=UPI0031739E3C